MYIHLPSSIRHNFTIFISFKKVDVIVNTASSDLNLSQGAVSASIVKYGGDSIQQECQSKYPNGINPGEIASTSGGKLDCKMVCHGALPPWDKDKGEAKKVGCIFSLSQSKDQILT